MKNENKNLILLKDYVSQAFLFERFEDLYNCPTGYGHNPFDSTCYPIPKNFDIAGIPALAPFIYKPRKLEPEPEPGPGPDNPPFIGDPENWKGLAVDLALAFENPLQNMKNCAQINPFTSFLAFAVNAPAGLTSYARLARAGVRLGKKTIKHGFYTGMILGSSIGFGKLAFGALGMAAALYGLSLDYDLDESEGMEKVLKDLKSEISELSEEAQKDPKTFLTQFAPSQYNAFCLLYMGAGAFMAGRILRTFSRTVRGEGLIGQRLRIEKQLQGAEFRKFMLGGARRGLGSFFSKYGKADDLSVLMFLKTKNKVDIDLQLNGNLGFTFQGSGKIEVDVSDLSSSQKSWAKKYISGNKISIDVDAANSILKNENSKIMGYIDASFRAQAGNEVKNIPGITGGHLQGNLQRIIKIMGRRGGLSRRNILKNYYKTTSEATEKVIEAAEPDIFELYKLQNQLNRQKKVLKDVPPSVLTKYRKKAAIEGNFSPQSIINDADFKKLSKQEKEKVFEYLNTYNQIHNKDLELSKKLAVAHHILREEAKFVENTVGRKPNFDDFFLSAEGTAASNRVSRKLDNMRYLFPTLEEAGLRSFTSTYGKFFFYPILAGGAVWASGKIPNLKNEVITGIVVNVTKEFVNKIDEDYLRSVRITPEDDDINLKKLFSDFEKFYKKTITKRPASIKSLAFVKELAKVAPKNEKVIEYFNKGKYPVSVSILRNNFLAFITEQAKQYGTKPEKLKEGKTIMKNKDIKTIVSEMLNESSGQGYAKYPYETNQYNDDEPKDDYIEEWKALAIQLIRDESRNTAIEVAKILVKDLELFEDVLDLAGQNQSVGTEILSKLKEARENK